MNNDGNITSNPEGLDNPVFSTLPEKSEHVSISQYHGDTGQHVTENSGVSPSDVVAVVEPSAWYDPYTERKLKHPTTNFDTWIHLIKGCVGTGILAMPNAFKNSGYVIGFFGTIIIGLICTYCIHVLIRCSYELCRRRRVPSMSYATTAVEAMGTPIAGHVVNGFMFIYQMGTCCIYIVFVSSSLQMVCNHYFVDLGVRWYMLFILLPLIAINCIRNLKLLAPFSTAANVFTIISFAITLYYVFRDGLPPLGEREPFGSLAGYPLFFGTVLFALEAIGVIMPLENNMQTPRSMGGLTGVMNRAMVVIVTLYVGLGLFGYLKYGDEVLGSITLNLPIEEVPAQIVQILLAVSIFISYALQCYVAVDIAWNMYISPHIERKDYRIIAEYGTRTALVLLSFSLAVAIPNLELFISLFGALCLSVLGIILPSIIECVTFPARRRNEHLVKNIVLVLFGFAGLVTGTYISIKDIIETFSE